MLFAACYAFTTYRVMSVTHGHLTYALDDAYIHMAIAKNLALHGVWGVQSSSFSAASSSPLWTAMLALSFKIVGVHDAVPLLLNTALALACIVAIGLILEQEQVSGAPMFAIIALVVLSAPLVPMVWIGMEHTLHILLTLVTAWGAASVSKRYSTYRLFAVCVLATLMVSARYEGLFVLAGCALVFASSRRLAAAVAITVSGALPAVCVGIWNVSHGWFFLPASIMMKQTVLSESPQSSLLAALASNIAHADPPRAFLVLLIAALLLLVYEHRSSGAGGVQPLLIIFVTAALLHLSLAKFGWLFRYESYLMALGVLSIGVSARAAWPPDSGRRSRALAPADLLVVAALVGVMAARDRTVASHAVTANVAGHIFRQHRQVAELLKRYYNTEPVALNDIGVVSYYTGARVYDLVGLASLEIATLRRAGRWDAPHINTLLDRNHVEVAVVYDAWFQGDRAFQRQWERIGEWTTDREDGRVEGTVTFFARNEQAGARLRTALRNFDAHLPDAEVDIRVFTPADPQP